MNRSNLIDTISEQTGLSKADSKKALNGIISALTDALASGDKVTLVGFGSFSVSVRAARTGINPAKKELIKIPAKKVVKFKANFDFSFDDGSGFQILGGHSYIPCPPPPQSQGDTGLLFSDPKNIYSPGDTGLHSPKKYKR